MRRHSCLAGLALVVILVGGCGGEGPAPILRPGDTAPAFSLTTLTGGKLSSDELTGGDPVILNFWATWCQPCLKELPVLNEMEAAAGVRVVAIALDEEGARVVEPFVEEHQLKYTILLGNQEVFQRFSGFTIPFTLVLDDTWTVAGVHRGPAGFEELAADLAAVQGRSPTEGP